MSTAKKSIVYTKMDLVTNLWKDLEEILNAQPQVKVETLPLSTEKHLYGGKVRLCYGHRPITECTLREKLDAVQYLDAFYDASLLCREQLLVEAEKAIEKLTVMTERFRELS